MIDREFFFDEVRKRLFGGNLSQSQVDGMDFLLTTWEMFFAEKNPKDWQMWLAYAMATTFHESNQTMRPIEEIGKGEGHDYAEPTGPYDQSYYGRGHVQLTWFDNYEKGEQCLFDKYNLKVPMVQYPHRMLEDETSSLILFEGMIGGWFTGVGLPKYFSVVHKKEDPYNARKIVNALDKASIIEGYYWSFKASLRESDETSSI